MSFVSHLCPDPLNPKYRPHPLYNSYATNYGRIVVYPIHDLLGPGIDLGFTLVVDNVVCQHNLENEWLVVLPDGFPYWHRTHSTMLSVSRTSHRRASHNGFGHTAALRLALPSTSSRRHVAPISTT